MSERTPRAEAADIAHALRRALERERALTGGELLAAGVARARRQQTPAPAGPAIAVAPAPAAGYTGRVAEPAAPAAPAFTLTPPDRDDPMPHGATPAPAPDLDAFDLPPFTADLNPAALGGGRDALAAAALPVLQAIAAEACACTACGLCRTRTQAVPGVGTARTGIVFVGEAPGADEDARGEPFVGRAGELLTRMIAAMDEKRLIPGVSLTRDSVYIANVLKCRPPENRNPLPHEVETCAPFLKRQLEALQPRVICCLGKFAAELLCGLKGPVGALRGRTFRYHGAKLIVTYHPAYCLRSPSAKKPVWEDLQRLAHEYLTD